MTRKNLIQILHREDFGHEYYAQIINFGKHWPRPFKLRSVMQLSVSWNDYPSWPYIQITSGNGGVLGVLVWVYKFGVDFDLLSRTWKFDHLEDLDDGDV